MWYEKGTKWYFGKQCVSKNGFHKNKRPISIDKADIRIIVLPKKNSYSKIGSLNILLDMQMTLMLFQYYYA